MLFDEHSSDEDIGKYEVSRAWYMTGFFGNSKEEEGGSSFLGNSEEEEVK